MFRFYRGGWGETVQLGGGWRTKELGLKFLCIAKIQFLPDYMLSEVAFVGTGGMKSGK